MEVSQHHTCALSAGRADRPELALLNRQTRAATVRASGGDILRVAAIGEQAFTRLLGPVKDIMARNVGERYGFAAGR